MTAAITDDSAGPTGPAAGPAATSPAADPAAAVATADQIGRASCRERV